MLQGILASLPLAACKRMAASAASARGVIVAFAQAGVRPYQSQFAASLGSLDPGGPITREYPPTLHLDKNKHRRARPQAQARALSSNSLWFEGLLFHLLCAVYPRSIPFPFLLEISPPTSSTASDSQYGDHGGP